MARETLLSLGAVLGTVCLVLTAAGWVLGIQPLVFRSGSMSPTIGTGALGIARSTPAEDLRPGDIVSVPTAGGERVTHRLVSSTAAPGGRRELVLKGDANSKRDAATYTVGTAYRVFAHVPKAGYVVSWAGGRFVQFGLGVFVMGMLLLIFRRPARSPDHPADQTDRSDRTDLSERDGETDGVPVATTTGPTTLRSLMDQPRHRQPTRARRTAR